MTRTLFRSLLAGCCLGLTALSAAAFDTSATAAFVLDQGSGTVLMSKNADEPLPPASMSKLMTLYMAFEAIRDGRLKPDEKLPVSAHAMSYGGSSMFLDTTDQVSVEDLLRGIIVLSGNDACAVIAEALSPDGTEAGFARYMTQRAHQMGMKNSTFQNSNGWPQAGHQMSMRDIAILANRIITDFPEFYPMFSETEFAFDGRVPQNSRNRNPLLRLEIGADGLKTGYTQAAGYSLVGSAIQGDRRVIFVISGLDSPGRRAKEAEAIVNWSFRNFVEKTIARKDHPIAQAEVWMGREASVTLVPGADHTAMLPALADGELRGEVRYVGPVRAPVRKGQQLGELVITPEGLPEISIPLVADRDISGGGFMMRVGTAARYLIAGSTAALRGAR